MGARFPPAVSALVVLWGGLSVGQEFRRSVADTDGEALVCITWSRRDITYTVDAAGNSKTPGDAEFAAIDLAFASWQGLSESCSDFQFMRGPRTPNLVVGKKTEHSNGLIFREVNCYDVVSSTDPCLADGSCANTHRCWDHSDATIALTTTSYSVRTGVVYDADIEFNASPHSDGTSFLFTTVSSPVCELGAEGPNCAAYDIQNTATHEIGHLVGLDHVEDLDSTMAATAPLGETSKRVIDLGTAAGFCLTYPRGQPPVPCDQLAQLRRRVTAKSIGTFGCGCHVSPGLGLPVAVGLGALLLRRRRRQWSSQRVGAPSAPAAPHARC